MKNVIIFVKQKKIMIYWMNTAMFYYTKNKDSMDDVIIFAQQKKVTMQWKM